MAFLLIIYQCRWFEDYQLIFQREPRILNQYPKLGSMILVDIERDNFEIIRFIKKKMKGKKGKEGKRDYGIIALVLTGGRPR